MTEATSAPPAEEKGWVGRKIDSLKKTSADFQAAAAEGLAGIKLGIENAFNNATDPWFYIKKGLEMLVGKENVRNALDFILDFFRKPEQKDDIAVFGSGTFLGALAKWDQKLDRELDGGPATDARKAPVPAPQPSS